MTKNTNPGRLYLLNQIAGLTATVATLQDRLGEALAQLAQLQGEVGQGDIPPVLPNDEDQG